MGKHTLDSLISRAGNGPSYRLFSRLGAVMMFCLSFGSCVKSCGYFDYYNDEGGGTGLMGVGWWFFLGMIVLYLVGLILWSGSKHKPTKDGFAGEFELLLHTLIDSRADQLVRDNARTLDTLRREQDGVLLTMNSLSSSLINISLLPPSAATDQMRGEASARLSELRDQSRVQRAQIAEQIEKQMAIEATVRGLREAVAYHMPNVVYLTEHPHNSDALKQEVETAFKPLFEWLS